MRARGVCERVRVYSCVREHAQTWCAPSNAVCVIRPVYGVVPACAHSKDCISKLIWLGIVHTLHGNEPGLWKQPVTKHGGTTASACAGGSPTSVRNSGLVQVAVTSAAGPGVCVYMCLCMTMCVDVL